MLDLATELLPWAGEGRDFAVATVTGADGSTPRAPGAALAVDGAGTAIGSVSGGCVEGAVYELCRQTLQTGVAHRERFAHSPEDAFATGLTCGGVIDVLITPIRANAAERAVYAAALSAAARGERAALARIAGGPAQLLGRPQFVRPDGTYEGTYGRGAALDARAAAEARALLDSGVTGTVEIGAERARCGEPLTVLVESSAPPPRMIVFGAVDFTAALVRLGTFLGYRVTVCDARPVFATRARFPEADELVVDWPHRYLAATPTDSRTALCVLTHDAKFDVPLLRRALRLPVAYVGAMGSRRTHEDRLARLRTTGLTPAELARLRSPIGLDLGGRTPEETALSIAAEIVATRYGGHGHPLTGGRHPIHHDLPHASAARPEP